MRLTCFISSLAPGGAERIMSDLCNHWVRSGHTVTLITFAGNETPPFYPLNPNINLIQLKSANPEIAQSPLLVMVFKAFSWIRAHIKKSNPDIIISFMDLTNILVILSSLGLKYPIIISERANPRFRLSPRQLPWLPVTLITQTCFLLYRKTKAFVVQTESTAKFFPNSFRKFMHIIPNAVKKPQLLKTHYAEQPRHIISVGRLDTQKDHRTLICAVADLLPLHPDLKLTLYGEGEEKENHLELIKTLKIENSVTLAGLSKDIPTHLLNADLFVFPSLTEGFPNALCEAMAIGLPIIASDCSGNIDVVTEDENGLLFKAGDKDSLIYQLKKIFSNNELYKYIGENGKKLSETYSQQRIYNKWDKLMSDVKNKP